MTKPSESFCGKHEDTRGVRKDLEHCSITEIASLLRSPPEKQTWRWFPSSCHKSCIYPCWTPTVHDMNTVFDSHPSFMYIFQVQSKHLWVLWDYTGSNRHWTGSWSLYETKYSHYLKVFLRSKSQQAGNVYLSLQREEHLCVQLFLVLFAKTLVLPAMEDRMLWQKNPALPLCLYKCRHSDMSFRRHLGNTYNFIFI